MRYEERVSCNLPLMSCVWCHAYDVMHMMSCVWWHAYDVMHMMSCVWCHAVLSSHAYVGQNDTTDWFVNMPVKSVLQAGHRTQFTSSVTVNGCMHHSIDQWGCDVKQWYRWCHLWCCSTLWFMMSQHGNGMSNWVNADYLKRLEGFLSVCSVVYMGIGLFNVCRLRATAVCDWWLLYYSRRLHFGIQHDSAMVSEEDESPPNKQCPILSDRLRRAVTRILSTIDLPGRESMCKRNKLVLSLWL